MHFTNTAIVFDRIKDLRKEAYLRRLQPGFRQQVADTLRHLANYMDNPHTAMGRATKAKGGSYVHS